SALRGRAVKPIGVLAQYRWDRWLDAGGSLEGAVAESRRVLTLEPDFADAHLALGAVWGDVGRLDAAISEFRRVLALRPGDRRAQQYLEMAIAAKAPRRR